MKEKKEMFYLFVLCIIIFFVGSFVFVVNVTKVDKHQSLIRKLLQLRDNIIETKEINLPKCSAYFVFDSSMDKIISSHSNGIKLLPNMFTPEMKKTIITRAISGGGIIRIPWKQRIKSNNLVSLSAVVFSPQSDQIGIVLVC